MSLAVVRGLSDEHSKTSGIAFIRSRMIAIAAYSHPTWVQSSQKLGVDRRAGRAATVFVGDGI